MPQLNCAGPPSPRRRRLKRENCEPERERRHARRTRSAKGWNGLSRCHPAFRERRRSLGSRAPAAASELWWKVLAPPVRRQPPRVMNYYQAGSAPVKGKLAHAAGLKYTPAPRLYAPIEKVRPRARARGTGPTLLRTSCHRADHVALLFLDAQLNLSLGAITELGQESPR